MVNGLINSASNSDQANGRKYAASSTDQSRQREINGKAYLFDENGVMIPQLSLRSANIRATSSNARVKYPLIRLHFSFPELN